MQFGDDIACLLLELARRLLAEEFKDIDPLAAKHLKRNVYKDESRVFGMVRSGMAP